MPLFRFVFQEDVVLEDVKGIELPDYQHALAQAKQAAQETVVHGGPKGRDPTSWVVRVYNEPGDLIGTIFLADLFKADPQARRGN
ncbi:DUF6894 family protein [Phyllobacterium bourgognense]|uniref:DUF6894 domain-containing protein n=1 Tax=Phyllobacterium bourgognense TaxID=314236 RepID=A0A368YIQ5_9HYPH|nr:hypothetical protein [Phyllobacterium bourgognense]RCW80102.1 hypothetical protein C7476_11567 [Phyllobacterium bourgognense]